MNTGRRGTLVRLFVGIAAVIVALLAVWYLMRTAGPRDVQEFSVQTGAIALASSAFSANGAIPKEYTCEATAVQSPPLSISGVPTNAQTLVLIVDDPDVPKQIKPDGLFTHWVVFNIPATTTAIAAGETVGTAGSNGAGQAAYAGPCPPKEYSPSKHRYFFVLYALDTSLPLSQGATRDQVLAAMQGHIVAQTYLAGTYEKSQ